MQQAIVKPKEGLTILNPSNGVPIKPQGEKVTLNKYFFRRLADGDLVIVDEPKKQSKSKSKAKANQPKAKIDESTESTETPNSDE